MNYRMVFGILGKVFVAEAVLLLFPMLVGIIYAENNFLAFFIPVVGLLAIGVPLVFMKSKDNSMYAKEGFVTVSLAWIIMSLVGAVPFVISGEITSYVDAVFETVSGFTTTGASILSAAAVDGMSKGMMFWRLFTHWIGGMGILVFVLAVVPTNSAGVMHVFRTESPGPSVGKLVSKLSATAKILYGIYFVMTIIETVLLLFGGLPFYDALLLSFTTAGTGGFSVSSTNAVNYSSYVQIVIAIFMVLFAVNFNTYYLILIGQARKAFASEEVRIYLITVMVATVAIALNVFFAAGELFANFGDALKHSFFQVSSIISTTGLATADFNYWPEFSQAILIILTIVGSCGGSTGGGIKFARLVILGKSTSSNFKRLIHPRAVVTTKFEGEPLNKDTERNVKTYFVLWFVIVVVSVLLLTFDSYTTLFEDLSATLACIGNVGPGFGVVGPMGSYGGYNVFSKIILSAVMLIGRLEIFPILLLFAPHTWKRG
ncbi:MAG: TrkH family potassium uptake protein [Clostridia bacterium]|nr:TrkH family potassium uptake protein [Clostridia bacterium]